MSRRRSSPHPRKLTKEQIARRERAKTVGKWTLLLLGTYEAFLVLVHRRQTRRDAFNAALNKKRETGKPLLVVGDPDGSFVSRLLGRDFDCSDLCIDVKGCPACSNMQAGNTFDLLSRLHDNSYVVFVDSGHLESVKSGDDYLAQLQRVSGGDFFVAHREPWSVGAFSPFMKRRVLTAPPITPYVEWRNLPWGGQPHGLQHTGPAQLPGKVAGLHWQRWN